MTEDSGAASAESAPTVESTQDSADVEPDHLSAEDRAMYLEAGKELTPPKMLDRIAKHNEFITSNIGIVGTLLTGLGGATAILTISRTTWYVGALPVIPTLAALASILAMVSYVVVVFARRPQFFMLNEYDAVDVAGYFDKEIRERAASLKLASRIFLAAVLAAATTALAAGYGVVFKAPYDPTDGPRNMSSLSTSVGDGGAVSVKLGGAVDFLDTDGQHLTITVISCATPATGSCVSGATAEQGSPLCVVPKGRAARRALVSVTAFPDADGKAALDYTTTAPVGTSHATAVIAFAGGDAADPICLDASYPKIKKPPKDKAPGKGSAASSAKTSAVLSD